MEYEAKVVDLLRDLLNRRPEDLQSAIEISTERAFLAPYYSWIMQGHQQGFLNKLMNSVRVREADDYVRLQQCSHKMSKEIQKLYTVLEQHDIDVNDVMFNE